MGGALVLLRPQFGLSPSQVGLLGASTFLGAMVGMLIFGDVSDRWGRRTIFVQSALLRRVFGAVRLRTISAAALHRTRAARRRGGNGCADLGRLSRRHRPAAPALLVLIGRQGLPESPRWLIAHGRLEEARLALARFGIEADGSGSV